ncbi:MAG: Gfo/Idh/MocA family protein [Phycisphaeraceae bacterium]
MNEVRLGVIGCGGMARSHMGYFDQVPGLRFTAAADVAETCVQPVGEQFGVNTFPDGHALIRSGEVDAVLIVTPHRTHVEYAVAAFEAGLHVLTEKPAAVTAKDAQRMNDAADAHPELVFAIMLNQRTSPTWRKVRQFIDEDRVGKIVRVSWIMTDWFRTQAYFDSGTWRATWQGEGGGVLLNQAPHNIDILQWLVGMPCRVTAMAGVGKYHHIEVEDEVTAMLEYPSGATGVFVTSTGEAPGTNRLEIVGDKATVVATPGHVEMRENSIPTSEFRETDPSMWGKPAVTHYDITPGEKDPGHRGITENFIAAILRGEKLIADGREGIRSLELANAMLMSGLKGQPVELPMDRDAYAAMIDELAANSTFHKAAPPDVDRAT